MRVFKLMEEINHFFHQPMHYENPEDVEKFATENYDEIRIAYYDILWNWLPKEEKRRIEEM